MLASVLSPFHVYCHRMAGSNVVARLRVCLLILLFCLSPALQAQLPGVHAGVVYWYQSPGGEIRSSGDDYADVEDDLGIGDDRAPFAWVGVDTPTGLPGLRFQYTPVSLSGTGTVERAVFRFGSIDFSQDTRVRSELELDQADFIAYLTPVDGTARVDLGLNFRYLDGRAEIEDRDSGDRERISFSGFVPLAYGQVRLEVPGSGLYAALEGHVIAYSGNRLLDLNASLGYLLPLGVGEVGMAGGYRWLDMRVDDLDGFDADVHLAGPWLGVVLAF